MDDADCPICKGPMSVAVYDASVEAGGSGDTVRLQCHHAFHGHCIVEALRLSGSACPVCRDGQGEDLEQLFINALNELNEDEEEETDDLLEDIRSRHEGIKRERHALNCEVRRYNIWKDGLRHRRKMVLEEVMKTFRRNEIPMAHAFRNDIQNRLQSIVNKETAEYVRRSSREALEAAPWYEASQSISGRTYLSEGLHLPRQDPMNSHFWYP